MIFSPGQLLFASVLLCWYHTLLGSVITEAFERREYDTVITYALESKGEFTVKESLLIAESYLRKGDKLHALDVYRGLLIKKELFPDHIRIVWPLLDDTEKTSFVGYYFATFGYNQELFYNYYFFARSQYRDDELATVMEMVLSSVQQADMLDFLASYYVTRGSAEEKLQQYGIRHIITPFIAISANNVSVFIAAYQVQPLQWQRTLVQYCMRRKKRTMLQALYAQNLLTETSHLALFDILEHGHAAATRYTLDTHQKRQLLTDLTEFDAMDAVKVLVQAWNKPGEPLHDFRGKIALSEKDHTAAFRAYYEWYKTTGMFEGAMFRELISFVSIKQLTMRDDKFWMQFSGMVASTKDAEKIFDILPLLEDEKNKVTMLRSVIHQFPYSRTAPFIRALSPNARIDAFAEVMMDNADTALTADIRYIQTSEYAAKHELLGDIYLFFKNDPATALEHYSAIKNQRERTYRTLLVHYLRRDSDAFFAAVKTFSPYYKACMLMEGDMLIARGDSEEGYGKYTAFVEKTYSPWLRNDAQRRIYLYLTDTKALSATVVARSAVHNYILWR